MSYFIYRLADKVRSYEVRNLNDLLVFFKIIVFSLKTLFIKPLQVRPSSKALNIGFIFSGGIGDQVISAQWVKVFIEKLISQNISFYSVLMFPKEKNGKLITCGFSRIDKIATRSYLNFHKFDLLIGVDQFVKIYSINYKYLNKYANTLVKDIHKAQSFTQDLIHFSSHEYHYSVMNYALMKNWNRYDLMGACGLCEFGRKTIPFFYINRDEKQKVLEKFNLNKTNFITIHTGVGDIPNIGISDLSNKNTIKQYATRCIPLPLCEKIVTLLKIKVPNVCVVQIGEPDSLLISNVDIQLVGKTSFEESLYLLNSSQCHIDNDAGLIHIRHAMNKRSVVLYGPTAADFVGYENDINIQGSCTPCMWLSSDWNVNCFKGYNEALCMSQINANKVVDGVCTIIGDIN
ncbi:glycosyltransferase family 9 protein [Succinatimonas hippei]|uniref:Heptosyltransferase n=1 Tax=Succinatimonas hippei (strain DSM 22608 / JCM 16073 / KCTC 15190 / YIT 12066) TaxID=762983 RepID=E8LL40_SUCHY|nr:glycosyltransferase family 9 protein [Succinatimonas hippei]EFY06765.1 hypothetical protein HMPREF9444_01446 [Succinatimonas hippei YIT 12066]